MSTKYTAALLLSLCASMLTMPDANAYSEADFQTAFQSLRAGAGNEERAAKAFQNLLNAEPGQPLLMAYAGSATSRLAVTTIFPWKKMSYAEEGLAMIDKSLILAEKEPTQLHGHTLQLLEIKLVAASTFLAVPEFMNRHTRGQKLLDDILVHPQLSTADLGFRGEVWMRAARLAQQQKRIEDAKKLAEEVIRNQAPQAEKAKQLLQGLSA
jgi:tetratricopeptide (TPR) repeat protein